MRLIRDEYRPSKGEIVPAVTLLLIGVLIMIAEYLTGDFSINASPSAVVIHQQTEP